MQSRYISDPTLSDISFKMERLWSGLPLISSHYGSVIKVYYFEQESATKTYWIQIHQTPTKYFLDLRTRPVDKYDQEEPVQTRSHEEDSFDRLYSCLEKIMILLTIVKLHRKRSDTGLSEVTRGHVRSREVNM